jgi:hypothetical protein
MGGARRAERACERACARACERACEHARAGRCRGGAPTSVGQRRAWVRGRVGVWAWARGCVGACGRGRVWAWARGMARAESCVVASGAARRVAVERYSAVRRRAVGGGGLELEPLHRPQPVAHLHAHMAHAVRREHRAELRRHDGGRAEEEAVEAAHALGAGGAEPRERGRVVCVVRQVDVQVGERVHLEHPRACKHAAQLRALQMAEALTAPAAARCGRERQAKNVDLAGRLGGILHGQRVRVRARQRRVCGQAPVDLLRLEQSLDRIRVLPTNVEDAPREHGDE